MDVDENSGAAASGGEGAPAEGPCKQVASDPPHVSGTTSAERPYGKMSFGQLPIAKGRGFARALFGVGPTRAVLLRTTNVIKNNVSENIVKNKCWASEWR